MLTIFPLREENIAALVEIENFSFAVPKDEAFFRSEQDKYLVAWEGHKIVGYIGREQISGETHIINMAVHPDDRNKGIGKRLIEAVLNDTEVFFLEVRVSNLVAQNLYKKYGFKIIGTRKKYYADNNEDACIMRRDSGG